MSAATDPVANVRVRLPDQLQRLARLERGVTVAGAGAGNQQSLVGALERQYPALRGTIRDHAGVRRPRVRIFACNEDISHDPVDAPLPAAIVRGEEPLFVLGAISGG